MLAEAIVWRGLFESSGEIDLCKTVQIVQEPWSIGTTV
jgi:hypothetical protein